MSENSVGKAMSRIDGRAKVSGQAKYASDFSLRNMAYAALLQSTISKGKIREISTEKAKAAPGVLRVWTHENAPRVKQSTPDKKMGAMPADQFLPLQEPTVFHDGQTIAMVVAQSPEAARSALRLIAVEYTEEKPVFHAVNATDAPKKPARFFEKNLQIQRGNAQDGKPDVAHDYSTAVLNHNPMEPSATVADWDGTTLTVYDATQGIMSTRNVLSQRLGLAPENVRVLCPFVGGGFGCKGFSWPHTLLAAMAAIELKIPVNLTLTRQQMFTQTGHREETEQHVELHAEPSGVLSAAQHKTLIGTSRLTEFVEPCGLATSILYSIPNLQVEHALQALDIPSPTPMRAPGECPGTFAIESAMDELAYALKIDPVALRLKNYANEDPQEKKPWSLKKLAECYKIAGEKFGWSERKQPRATQRGNDWIGWGMATATYPGNRGKAAVRARLYANGQAVFSSSTQDLGTGTYTIMTQIASDALGVATDKIRFELGDSSLPPAPVSGGSQTAASVGAAVKVAGEKLRLKIIEAATKDARSPLYKQPVERVGFADGKLFLTEKPETSETFAALIARSGADSEAVLETVDPMTEEKTHSYHSFGAHFVEVRVDKDLNTIRVSRVVSAFDIGRVLNQKTARSQAMGGIVFGIGMALLEETVRDPKTGRTVTRNLADYLLPVNADIPEIDVHFIDEPDPVFGLLGARGVGEIGITGITAAIANAVFHATGKRVRALPITLDKLF